MGQGGEEQKTIMNWVGGIRTEVLKASRTNGNGQPLEIGSGGDPLDYYLGGKRLSEHKGRDVGCSALQRGKGTYRSHLHKRTGHQLKSRVAIPQ